MLVLLLCLVGVVAGKLVNIAPNGTISATSVGWGGVPQRAIDGDTNGYWGGGSCFHSRNAGNEKLFLSLPGGDSGVKYPIARISVFNRQDACCRQRLQGMEIWAGDQKCGVLTYKTGQQEYSVDCKNKEASVVTVYHPTQYLQVCELRVFVEDSFKWSTPKYTNVALGRPAAQSSVGWGGAPQRAVDGNTNKKWTGRSCTHTSRKSGNWWTVQLDKEQYVEQVVIHNRIDCCSDRIGGAKVWVGRGSEYEHCGTVSYKAGSSPIIVVKCNKYGDSIKITNDNSYLTLCEVEVLVPEETPSEEIDE